MEIMRNSAGPGNDQVQGVIGRERLLELRRQAETLHVEDGIYDYLLRLTEATRQDPRIALGVSPRGGIALLRMARAMALLRGGEYVIPEDVLSVIDDVWRHRIRLHARARAEGMDVSDILMDLTERIRAV